MNSERISRPCPDPSCPHLLPLPDKTITRGLANPLYCILLFLPEPHHFSNHHTLRSLPSPFYLHLHLHLQLQPTTTHPFNALTLGSAPSISIPIYYHHHSRHTTTHLLDSPIFSILNQVISYRPLPPSIAIQLPQLLPHLPIRIPILADSGTLTSDTGANIPVFPPDISIFSANSKSLRFTSQQSANNFIHSLGVCARVFRHNADQIGTPDALGRRCQNAQGRHEECRESIWHVDW